MKIGLFISNSPTSGWNMGHGISHTLKRMGHEVVTVMMPTETECTEALVRMVKSAVPKIETLKEQDVIIVSGPEHIGPWIDMCYEKQPWKEIDVPKAVWLHESTSRDDYDIDFHSIKWMGQQFFFPAVQDAEFHDQEMFAKGRSHWLPFGVDTEIFKPWFSDDPKLGPSKEFDVGFLGMMYQKRQIFMRALSRHKIPPVHTGMCVIQDIRGYDWEGSMRLLASNTREIKVFFNMPSMSRLFVAKVMETMACGTFLFTPALTDARGADKNMELFKDGEHLAYYSPSNMPLIAQRLNEWISPERDSERQKIAEAGCRLIHERHTIERRLNQMFAWMFIKEEAKSIAAT